MPNLPALPLGAEPDARVFWILYAAYALRHAVRWGGAHWWGDVQRAVGYARGGA